VIIIKQGGYDERNQNIVRKADERIEKQPSALFQKFFPRNWQFKLPLIWCVVDFEDWTTAPDRVSDVVELFFQ
jgi:hypothetical protein